MSTTLSAAQRRFFDSFGYLVLPGLMADDVEWLTEEFERNFEERGENHDGTYNTAIQPFVDHRQRLRDLIDDPRMTALFAGLLGDDWFYWGSSGHLYGGDTGWHPDASFRHMMNIKVSFYLDPVRRDAGALRVIPGSHRLSTEPESGTRTFGEDARLAAEASAQWGIGERDVPSIALEVDPGDVIAFNQNLVHASFGGGRRRRLFTINACTAANTPAAVEELTAYIDMHAKFWMDSMFDPVLVETASPERRRRLEQTLAHQGNLSRLSGQARREMDQPAWKVAARRGPAPST